MRNRKKILELEEKTSGFSPVGKPKIIEISGHEHGIDYIFAIGSKDGLHDTDRERLMHSILYEIERDALPEANAFMRSEIKSKNSNCLGWYGVLAVQYYKLNKSH